MGWSDFYDHLLDNCVLSGKMCLESKAFYNNELAFHRSMPSKIAVGSGSADLVARHTCRPRRLKEP